MTKEIRCDLVVTTYINPDLDGVACCIGYAQLLNSVHQVDARPVIEGVYDGQTRFCLSEYSLSEPFRFQGGDRVECESFVLCDTHHVRQLPRFVRPEWVLEIIDHHPEGDLSIFTNAKCENAEVGAAATLVEERAVADGFVLSSNLRGLLSCAIISNTLNFSAPSTSERDRAAYGRLKAAHSEEFILNLIGAKTKELSLDPLAILLSDVKEFQTDDGVAAISQLETAEARFLPLLPQLAPVMKELKAQRNWHLFVFSLVDISSKRTHLIGASEFELTLLREIYSVDPYGVAILDHIALRKTEVVPRLMRALAKT